jgi:LSD1 subclass zinc finger protein
VDTISVSCNNCGAPLEVPRGARYLTCNYCNSRLEVHATDSATYTDVLETIQEKTSQMADDLGAIRRQNELEQLDRQWALERQEHLVHGKDGSTSEPATGAGMIVGGLFVVFFAVVCVGMGISALNFAANWHGPGGGPGLFALVPFGMAIFAVVAFVASMASMGKKASEYAERKRQYEQRRARILAETNPPRPPDDPS